MQVEFVVSYYQLNLAATLYIDIPRQHCRRSALDSPADRYSNSGPIIARNNNNHLRRPSNSVGEREKRKVKVRANAFEL